MYIYVYKILLLLLLLLLLSNCLHFYPNDIVAFWNDTFWRAFWHTLCTIPTANGPLYIYVGSPAFLLWKILLFRHRVWNARQMLMAITMTFYCEKQTILASPVQDNREDHDVRFFERWFFEDFHHKHFQKARELPIRTHRVLAGPHQLIASVLWMIWCLCYSIYIWNVLNKQETMKISHYTTRSPSYMYHILLIKHVWNSRLHYYFL